jgi:tryptophan-rich sensory protein
MEEITLIKISSKEYAKRKKRISEGVTVTKKPDAKMIKSTFFHASVSALFYVVTAALCFAATKIRTLWLQTIVKPPLMASDAIFCIINIAVMLILIYILFVSLQNRDKEQIISLIINGIFFLLLFYMFFVLCSPLGSLVLISVHTAQTFTVFFGIFNKKKIHSLLLIPVIIWQLYNLFIIYLILMLN